MEDEEISNSGEIEIKLSNSDTISTTSFLPEANTNEIKEVKIDRNKVHPIEIDKISINADTTISDHPIGGITANQSNRNGIKDVKNDKVNDHPIEMNIISTNDDSTNSHDQNSGITANQTDTDRIYEATNGSIPTTQNNIVGIQSNVLSVKVDSSSSNVDSTISHHDTWRTTANQTDTDGIQEPMIDVTHFHPVVIDDNSSNPLQIQVRRSQQHHCPPGVLAYPMKSKPRGNVLIINNIEFADEKHKSRFGGQVDSANLKNLFLQLGFQVAVHHNLGQRAMRKEIIRHSELDSHYQADMGVVCLLSHGEETDKMRSCDGAVIDLEWVYRKYRSDSCPPLHGKPKLFLIQACRGDDTNGSLDLEDECFAPGAHKKAETSTDRGTARVPNGEDILIVNSTVPSFVAHRDTKRGSWLIECFCEVVMENAFNTDLRDMLDMVAEKLRGPKYEDNKGNKQIFEYSNRHFRKKLYFNPGIYEDKIKQRKDYVKEITIRTEPKTTFNQENEILTKFYSDKEKVLESLKCLLKVFSNDTITVDQFSDSGISNTLYDTIRPTYNVETPQGRNCRIILKKMQSVVKSDPDYEDEDLPPITPVPDGKKNGRSLFTRKKDQA